MCTARRRGSSAVIGAAARHGLLVSGVDQQRRRAEPPGERGLGEHRAHPRVGDDEREPVGRVRRVERQVRGAGPPDGEERDHHRR